MFVPITRHRPSSSHDVSNIHLLEEKNKTGWISSFAQGHVAKDDAWPVVRQADVANHKRGKKIKKIREDRDGRRIERVCVKGEREEEEEWRGEEWREMEASTTNGSRGAGECGQTWEMIRLALRSQEAAISGARHT